MKKLLLAATIATFSVSAAQAAPTVYGKLHVTVDRAEKGANANDVIEINSNASRLGVKGEEKLTDNLSAIYTAEWEVAADEGSTDFKKRNVFAGLKYAGLGTVKVGKFDSYLKASQAKIDIFNDLAYLDMGKMIAGENRLNNVVGFESDAKALGGLQFNVLAQQGEGTKLAGDNSKAKDEGFGDAVSTSITYTNKDMGVYAAVAGDIGVASKLAGKTAKADIVRVVGSLDLGDLLGAEGFTVGAMFQNAQPADLASAPADAILLDVDQEVAFLVSAGYTVPNTPWSVKAQYHQATTEFKSNAADMESKQYGGMIDYKFNSKTRAYGYLAQQKFDTTGQDDLNHVGLGMELKF